MPDPERKIEKLLRSFAKRRRAESAEPFQIHGATRQLLQREISQRVRAGEYQKSWLAKIIFLPRRRIAFALGALFIVAISIALLMPSITKNHSPTSLAKAAKTAPTSSDWYFDETKHSDTNSRISSDREYFLTDAAAPAAPSASAVLPPFEALEKQKQSSEDLPALQNPSRVAARASAVSREAETAATFSRRASAGTSSAPSLDTSNENLDSKRADASGTLSVKPEQPAGKSALGKINEGQTQPGTLAKTLTVKPLSNNLGYFARVESDDALLMKRVAGEAGAGAKNQPGGETYQFRKKADPNYGIARQTILNSFQVVGDGNDLRVIDEDGSVYSGTFEHIAANGRLFDKSYIAENKKISAPKDAQTGATRSITTSSTALLGSDISPMQSFKVSGTNRTLNAPVVLQGAFIRETNSMLGTFATGGSVKAEETRAQTTNCPSVQIINSRISGKARVGSNEITIEAQQVAP
jgi:hypothetical protein